MAAEADSAVLLNEVMTTGLFLATDFPMPTAAERTLFGEAGEDEDEHEESEKEVVS